MGFKKIMLVAFLLLAILTIGSVSASDDNATSLTVDEDLILESSNDEVLTTGEGTFSDLSTLINNAPENGVLELDMDYINNGSVSEAISISKVITIDGKGHKIDANLKSGIFDLDWCEVVIKNIKFVNAYSAAISGYSVNYDIINCSFYNSCKSAIDCGEGNIVNCTFVNNSDSDGGGAIEFIGFGTISNCTFVNNSARYGGAIYWRPYNSNLLKCNISNCIFVNNTASNGDGGAILLSGSYESMRVFEKADVNVCTFVNNSASGDGGAICWGCVNGILSNSTFENNTALNGGAVYFSGSNDTVSSCSFVKNSAKNDGGSIYWSNGDGKIENSNFTCSQAKRGSAIYVYENVNVTVNASKFENNVAEESGDVVYGATISNCTFTENNGTASSPLNTTTGIELNSSELYIGESLTLTVSVLDENDQPVNGNVEVFICSTSLGLKTIGEAFTYTPAQVGEFIVEARFNETSNYTESSNYASFTVLSKGSGNESSNVTPGNLKNESRTMVLVNSANVYLGDNIIITAIVSNKNSEMITGTVDVYVNSTFIGSKNINEAFAYTPDKLGKYSIEARFNETSDYNASSASATVNVIEKVVPEEITSDEDGLIILEFPSDAKGEVEVFINGVYVEVVKIINGIAVIDLSKYKGKYNVSFVYSGDDNYPAFKKDATVTIQTNPSIKVSTTKVLYSAGTTYKITVYKNKGILAKSVSVTIKLNNKKFKTIKTTSKGIASFKVTQKPGTYKLKITTLGTTVTKTLTVKHIVTLKAVKVKKSAKKLILQATLAKVNKKYLKKKTVTFKFNGKKYKAKTNAKGVAKVTIKKSVLKKLKVGKKVTYQATYLKDTVKKTAKIKK